MLSHIINKELPTKAVDSKIAQPVDLQYHDIADTNPIPTNPYGGRRTEIDDLKTKVVVSAGGSLTADFEYFGESETHLLISIDKQPWFAQASLGVWTSSSSVSRNTLFPKITSVDKAYSDVDPLRLLYVLPGEYSTYDEAYLQRQASAGSIYIRNSHATDSATVTVKVLRIWR